MSQKYFSQIVSVAVDGILINVAFFFSYVIRYEMGFPYPVDPQYDAPFFPSYVPFTLLLTALCMVSYRIDGLYEVRRNRRWVDEAYRLVTGTMTSIVIVMALTFFLQPLVYSRGMLVLAGVMIIAALGLARMVMHMIAASLRRRGIGVERVLVVGAGEVGRAVIRSLMAKPALGYLLVGYVDDDPAKGDSQLGRIRGFGGIENIASVLTTENINEVIVTLPWMYHRKIMQIVSECEREHVRVRVVPDVFQQRMRRVDLDSLNGIPLIGTGPATMSSSALLIKRIIDLGLILLALPFLLVIFAVVGLLIAVDSRGPILYKQRRIKKNGQPFDMYKFRTMIQGAEQMQDELREMNEVEGPIFKIKEDPRRTRIGRVLRRFSIDEIPQFINVVRGDMSIVGPRPGTPEEVAQYEPWQRERLTVHPGLTGLWQVSGRSNIPFAEMCLLDIFYIENWSLDMDIRIMLQTIPNLLLGHGAY